MIPYAFQSQDSQGGREKICVTEKKSGKNPEVLKSALAVLTPEVLPIRGRGLETAASRLAVSEHGGTAISRLEKAELLGERPIGGLGQARNKRAESILSY